MIDLLELHKFFIGNHLHAGDIAVDFTMGNGHDTAYLSKAVGPDGFVYAFDIQEQALASTQERLVAEGCPDNYRLILDSHSNVKKYVDVPFKAGMFNLGWLPGGDKSVTTLRETTLPAIRDAIDLMDRDAILNIAVYPGHAEGDAEGKIVVTSKARGRKNAVRRLADDYAEHADRGGLCGIAHGGCREDAETLRGLLKATDPACEVLLVDYEPVTGSHVGPGALALFYYGDEKQVKV